MTRLLAVIERDTRKFLRNPAVIGTSILMPLLYLIILGSSFQGELKNLPLAVVDIDNGPYSRRVLESLHSLEAGPKTIRLFHLSNQGDAIRGVKEGMYKAALIIPPDFSKDILRGRVGNVGLLLDNTESISSDSLRLAITGAMADIQREFVAVREEAIPRVREIGLYRKVDYDQTLIPGVVIMAIFLGAMTTGVFNTVMDRFMGIEESYLLTPLTKGEIVGGLIVSGLFITTLLALLVLFLSALISGIYLWKVLTLGGLGLIILVIILSTLGLLGLMFIILGRANHPRIVGVLGGFLNVIFFFPSGAIYPVESFPNWLRAFASVNPETYSVHALRSLLFKGATILSISGDMVYLSVFALVTITMGTLTFKRGL
ncbi:MAG: ABC transporter permease [Deltaproteobacteria bacterium]|nr:ABC transporter permease [Deltaproteobacteria bacterium]